MRREMKRATAPISVAGRRCWWSLRGTTNAPAFLSAAPSSAGARTCRVCSPKSILAVRHFEMKDRRIDRSAAVVICSAPRSR